MTKPTITVEDLVNELTDFANTINEKPTMTEARRRSVLKDLKDRIKWVTAAYSEPEIAVAAGFFHGSATGLNEIPFETVFPGEVA